MRLSCNECNKPIRTGACACRRGWSVVRVLDSSQTEDGNVAYYVGEYCKPRPNSDKDVKSYKVFDTAQRAADRSNIERGAH